MVCRAPSHRNKNNSQINCTCYFCLENEGQILINSGSHPRNIKSDTRTSRSNVVMLEFCSLGDVECLQNLF